MWQKLLMGTVLIMTIMVVSFHIACTPQVVEAYSLDELGEDIEDLEDSLGGGDETSFTDFKGTFEPPSADLYPGELTDSKNLRDFVLKLTDFILAFLGLAGVVMVIYGGVLYVTSRGEQDPIDKGKKVIGYAMMGIIIVIVSYALVNTLIQGASTGEEPGSTGSPAAPDGTATSVQFQQTSENIAREILTIAENMVAAYGSVQTNTGNIERIAAFIENSKDSGDDFAGEDKDQFEEILKKTRSELISVLNSVDDLGAANESIRKIIDYIDILDIAAIPKINYAEMLQANTFLAAAAKRSCTTHQDCLEIFDNILSGADFDGDGKEDHGIKDVPTDLDADFDDTLKNAESDLDSLESNFEDLGSSGGLAIEPPVILSFNAVKDTINKLKTEADNATMKTLIEQVKTLVEEVQTIQTVAAKINASVTEGNAPLTVVFDGLDSVDPGNQTIRDEQYAWDLYGNGEEDDTIPCKEEHKARVACTYEEGNYIVGLRVKSSNSNIVADGRAFIKIKVKATRSKIVLKAKPAAGSEETLERSYKVTQSEAQSGITFDASQTKDGDGKSIQSFTWDFGDGSTPTTEATGRVDYKYSEIRSYPFVLEVEDVLGNKDKKLVDIFVGSPVARILVRPESGNLDTNFTFDGGQSRTDEGQVISFQWTIQESDGDPVTIPSSTQETFEMKFDKPDIYTITLEVLDSTDKKDSVSTTFEVVSQEPTAAFTYNIPDPSQPGTVQFNASGSFDPDRGDTLSYLWTFPDLPTSTEQKPLVQFLSTGNKEVTLTVTDSRGKQDSVTKTIKIDSILDVALFIGGDPDKGESEVLAYQLQENPSTGQKEATVRFIAKSSVAVAYEINFGDGKKEIFAPSTEIQHTYTKAATFSVKLTAFDATDEDNSITRNVYIGSGDAPVAVMYVAIDGNPVEDTSQVSNANPISKLEFDGSQSLNLDGTGRKLNYLWTFERTQKKSDGTFTTVSGTAQTSSDKTVTKNFSDKGFHIATLTVSNEEDVMQKGETLPPFIFEIIQQPPQFETVLLTPQSGELITPLKVKIKALSALDPDGRIEQYRFWYYPLGDSSEKKGIQLTKTNETTLTINTYTNYDALDGAKDGKATYGFGLEVVDDEGNTFSKDSDFDRTNNILPTLAVTNGPNEPPKVSLFADRTSIFVGEKVNFSAKATDSDSEIDTYEWDLDGDGMFATGEGESSPLIQHIFTKGAPKGIPIKVRVTDKNGSDATSEKVIIYVDSDTEDPKADFRIKDIQFDENEQETHVILDASASKVDPTLKIESMTWDCDTERDSDLDGTKGNDVDVAKTDTDLLSAECVYDYFDLVRIKLTLIDSEGNTAEKTLGTNIEEPEKPNPPEAAFTFTISAGDKTGKTVLFDATNSKVDPEWTQDEVRIVNYEWDFDTNEDLSGNGKKDDDYESGQPISHSFEKYGSFTVKLVVTDNYANSNAISRTLTLKEPESSPVEARLISSPEPLVSDGKIHVEGEIEYVSFDPTTSQGENILEYILDKNINYDTNGNGKKEDDKDLAIIRRADGSYERQDSFKNIEYQKSWGKMVTRLTVKNDRGASDSVDLEIVFDGSDTTSPPLAAFTYGVDPSNEKKILFDSSNSSAEAGIADAIWDFNTSEDFDGDGVKSNDREAIGIKVEKTYNDSGNVSVKLTILDAKGSKDEVTRTITIPKPDETLPPQAAFIYQIAPDDTTGLRVLFDGTTSIADTQDTSITSYTWDFDLSEDKNGNGNSEDDQDATGESVAQTYEKYGNYRVKLTVKDSEGKTGDITRTLTLSKPEEKLDARLITTPSTLVSDGKIHVSGEVGKVSFDFSTSIGPIVKYALDKNVYYDTNGNGIKTDDEDLSATSAGRWDSIEFRKEWGRIISKLTVYDKEGKSDDVSVEIVFDESTGSTDISGVATKNGLIAILAVMLIFGILGVTLSFLPEKRNHE